MRLAADGLFANLKPSIAHWMLSPMGIRSSNMLETVQNQSNSRFRIRLQIVCWDADLRIDDGIWSCYNISGGKWQVGIFLGGKKKTMCITSKEQGKVWSSCSRRRQIESIGDLKKSRIL